MSDRELPAAVTMHGLLSGFQMSQALFAVAELDVATALLSGPREIEDLATHVGADADALGRIIRFLAQHGVFRTSGSTVEITDLGRTLADGQADSLRSVARYFRQTHYAPFGNLLDTVRTGEPAAKVFLGNPSLTGSTRTRVWPRCRTMRWPDSRRTRGAICSRSSTFLRGRRSPISGERTVPC